MLSFALVWLLPAAGVIGAETDCRIHDPSAIIQGDGIFWVFGTGPGIRVYSSQDRLHWTRQPPVFAAQPAWIDAAVPGHHANDFWAPDILRVGGRYCLYYAVSVFGRNTSAIGLAISPSLQTPRWTDQGIVIRSSRADSYNAIDPCVISDASGGLWLCFGSFWSGIKIMALDPATGKPLPGAKMFSVAAHPQDHSGSIEAPYLAHHQGFYYLFVNWGLCCRGEQSTYSIRIGRSRAIIGPYLDRDGRDLREGGGTVFLDTLRGSAGHKEVGPGQAGIESDESGNWFSCHYEWAEDRQGQPNLNISKLVWRDDGWPALVDPAANANVPRRTAPGHRKTAVTLQWTNRRNGIKHGAALRRATA